ncbi:Fur family transcriptional regulator [Kribbella sp. NPDC055110]
MEQRSPLVATGLRRTRQRMAILAILADSREFLSAQDLHRLLDSAGMPIGLTTVYRALHDFERVELLDVIRDDAGERYFRQRVAAEHRHYLICRRCGLNRPVDTEVVERWVEQLADDTEFAEVEHTLELVGVCVDCRTCADGES